MEVVCTKAATSAKVASSERAFSARSTGTEALCSAARMADSESRKDLMRASTTSVVSSIRHTSRSRTWSG
eukprot:scaffold49955_cov60-Phaeocystis_antarctica.AAC.4